LKSGSLLHKKLVGHCKEIIGIDISIEGVSLLIGNGINIVIFMNAEDLNISGFVC
jgi:hypothetical protein